MKKYLFYCLLILATHAAASEEILPAGKEIFVGKHFATLVLMQEQNGKRGFKLKYEKPRNKSSEEQIQFSDQAITRIEYPFTKGEQTLLAQYTGKTASKKREILVLYSAYLSLLSGDDGYYFYVAEEYQESIRYYAMFKSKPAAEQLLPIIQKAGTNPDSAIVATRWIGKESEIFIYDSSRLDK